MRFSTLVAFVLPLSALAAPVIPVDKLTAVNQLSQAINETTGNATAAVSDISQDNPAFNTISSLQANLATIPLTPVMQIVFAGKIPASNAYVDTPTSHNTQHGVTFLLTASLPSQPLWRTPSSPLTISTLNAPRAQMNLCANTSPTHARRLSRHKLLFLVCSVDCLALRKDADSEQC